MVLKKAMLLAAILTLSSTPAWALPGGDEGQGKPVAKGNPHGGPGSESGRSHSKGAGSQGGDPDKGKGGGNGAGKSKSHRCAPHAVAYVASGALLSESLVEGSDHTFSGEVTVEVTHGNRHARGDKGTNKTYKVEGVRLVLAVPDLDNDNVVGVDDLAPGDHVQVIGRITTIAKRCTVNEFTPQLTIKKIAFHGPRH